MIFHIVKRELHDHLSSLRFALTTLLILILMIVNAVAYLGEYNQQMKIYQKNIAATHNRLKRHSDTLYHLVLKGPGDLHKKPSPLAFCADGGKDLLFRHVRGGTASRTRRWEGEDTSHRYQAIGQDEAPCYFQIHEGEKILARYAGSARNLQVPEDNRVTNT